MPLARNRKQKKSQEWKLLLFTDPPAPQNAFPETPSRKEQVCAPVLLSFCLVVRHVVASSSTGRGSKYLKTSSPATLGACHVEMPDARSYDS